MISQKDQIIRFLTNYYYHNYPERGREFEKFLLKELCRKYYNVITRSLNSGRNFRIKKFKREEIYYNRIIKIVNNNSNKD